MRWRHPRARTGFAGRVHSARRGDRPDHPDRRLGAEAGLREAATWPSDLKVAVNLSPVQFKSGTVVSTWSRRSARPACSPARLELEITEAVLLQDTDATIATLSACATSASASRWTISAPAIPAWAICASSRSTRSRSTGRSSATCPSRPDSIAIVRAVTGLGSSLGMATTAEGVETEEQLAAAPGRRLHRGPGLSVQQADAGERSAAAAATPQAAVESSGIAVSRRSPPTPETASSALRSLLRADGASGRSHRRVQRHGGANERLQRLFIDLVALMEIDGAPGVAFEAGVEEA